MTIVMPRDRLRDDGATAELPPQVPRRGEGRRRASGPTPRRARFAAVLALVTAAHVVVALGLGIPVLRPVAGLVALALVPGLVALDGFRRRGLRNPERILYSTGFVLLGVLLVTLVVNYAGPRLGIARPLSNRPLATVSLVIDVVLLCWRPRSVADLRVPSALGWLIRPLTPTDLPVVVAVSAAGLSVLGAVRLNNSAGAGVAYAALVLTGVALLGLLLRHASVRVDSLVVYFSAATLLLGTSLRSWFVVGHDVLREYFFFDLAHHASHWDIGAYPDPYNACLSVTLLPTAIVSFTGLPGGFVFKVLLQLLFAGVPVATYLLSRRVVSRLPALVATIFVISFPTFWADMPYLVRQEVAFLFLALALLAATEARWRYGTRVAVTIAMAAGVVLSHYSTTYILILTVALGAACLALAGVVRRRRRPAATDSGADGEPRERPVMLSFPVLGALLVMAFVWTGPVTHTGGHLAQVAGSVVESVVHPGSAMGSSDLRYALLPSGRVSPQQRLDKYSRTTLRSTRAVRAQGGLLPLPPRLRLPRALHPPVVAPTSAGRWLAHATGVRLDPLNDVLRGAVARLLQVFLLLGALALLLRRAPARRYSADLTWLSVGATVALALQVMAPGLSVDYGILRAFQQGLLVLAPLVAVGCVWAFSLLGRFSRPVVVATAVGVFAVLTGSVAQALGGYSPQLHLANTGIYYDLYYRTPQDASGIAWVDTMLDRTGPAHPDRAVVSSDRSSMGAIAISRHTEVGLDDQIFPSLVRRDATVLVKATTLRDGRAAVFYGGDVIPYRYPVALLESTKSRLYDNGSVRVYR